MSDSKFTDAVLMTAHQYVFGEMQRAGLEFSERSSTERNPAVKFLRSAEKTVAYLIWATRWLEYKAATDADSLSPKIDNGRFADATEILKYAYEASGRADGPATASALATDFVVRAETAMDAVIGAPSVNKGRHSG